MSSLPAPLVAAEVDLTDFGFMPLDVRRLRDSRLAASSDGDEFRAAVLLWCAAWHQKPAASLPDDDLELAQLAGYGRVLKEWRKVREGALHGWIKCSDGRFYHPVVAEKANESWAQKREHAWSRECDRIRKENKKRAESGEPSLRIPPRPSQNSMEDGDGIPTEREVVSAGNPSENALKGQGKDIIDSKPNGLDVHSDELAVAAYNAEAGPLKWPLCAKLTPSRRSALRVRIREAGGLAEWQEAMRRAGRSPFLRGESGRGNGHENWRPNIDFFLTAKNFTRLIEGAYDGPQGVAAPPPSTPKPKDDDEAQRRLDVGRSRHEWPTSKWGPMPGADGCLIPPHLIKPGDGQGWREWGASQG